MPYSPTSLTSAITPSPNSLVIGLEGPKPVSPVPQQPIKEVIREKEILREVVKIRCRHCGELFEERSSHCPHCGAPA